MSPRLASWQLTSLLGLMVAMPTITIALLWSVLPSVYEGELQASVYAEGTPPAEFYDVPFEQRPPAEDGVLVIQNNSDVDWTMLNIHINRFYQIYDVEPIPAREERRYKLNKFITRAGARFDLKYNPLKSVLIYARQPNAERATYSYEFPKQ
ncbi:MAG: hypothetical protein AAFN77_13985 [Planctomycetota bacterium]